MIGARGTSNPRWYRYQDLGNALPPELHHLELDFDLVGLVVHYHVDLALLLSRFNAVLPGKKIVRHGCLCKATVG